MLTYTSTADRYTVSGNSYTINFPYWKEAEVKAVITLTDGTMQDLVLDTDYSVSTPNGNNGTLTKLTAWTDANKLTIYRDSAKTQDVDLVQGQKINADTIENALDHAIAINQELQEKLSRSITTSIDEAGSDIQIPDKATRAGMILGFDNSGENAALRSLAQFDNDVANTATNAGIASAAASSATTSDLKAEGYAVGEQGGVPVTGGTYYHNNAKYYSNTASSAATLVNSHATALNYLKDYSANVDTVAGIGTQVNTVAGISSSVPTVASNSANITTVATNISGVNTVASNIAGVLAADDYASLSRQYSEGKKLDGTTVAPTDEGYHNNSKYYLDIVKQTISGALRYQGVWTTTGATDYSGISLPRLKGDMFYCQGSACTIGGVTYSQGDYIIFNQDVASGTITTAMIDKIDNTETVTPDNLATLTNKTIDANNNTLKNVVTSKNITNCITKIPQDINLTLSSGTLTLKAGSKVYVPNGSGNFETYTLPEDKTITNTDNAVQMICVQGEGSGKGNLLVRRLPNCVSGAGATTTAGFAYNTTTNQIRGYNAEGTDFGVNYSFPIAIVTVSGGAISSIDQVFNGMGYIGSTLFVLPNVKVLFAYGRNADGTLKNVETTSTSVKTALCSSNGARALSFSASSSNIYDINPSNYYYDEALNTYIDKASGDKVTFTILADYTTTSGVVSNFKPKTAFHAVDWSDERFNYSTGETRTGETWIDGKPIYRKTVTFTNSADQSAVSASIGVSNINEILKYEGFSKTGSGGFIPINFYNSTNYSSCYADATNISYRSSFTGLASKTVYVTLYFTKTTD